MKRVYAFILILLLPLYASAYFATTNTTETYYINSNESAFWVPSKGATKDNQAEYNTIEFYKNAKIPGMLFNIPHIQLSGYNLVFKDPYIPAGRLYIVEHTPYHREWTPPGKGTNAAKDESLQCQSKEGLDVNLAISVTTSIKEENAHKYLYYFGSIPTPNPDNKPEISFQSVHHARKLDWVMDNVGRGIIGNIACREISSRSLDKVNEEAGEIMNKITTDSIKFLGDRGITVDSIGWAGTFTFSKEIQEAIDNVFISQKIKSIIDVLQAKADIKIKEGFAAGLSKGIPSFIPPSWVDWISKALKSLGPTDVPSKTK